MGRNTGPSRRQPSGKCPVPRYAQAGGPGFSRAGSGERAMGERGAEVDGRRGWVRRRGRHRRGRCSDVGHEGARPEQPRAARAAARGERRAGRNVFDTLRPRACLAASSRPLLASPACATRAGTMNAPVEYVGSTLPLQVPLWTPPTVAELPGMLPCLPGTCAQHTSADLRVC